jgi:hypothetical protein
LPPPPSARGKGTKDDPWTLKTPPGTSEFRAYRDETLTPPSLVVWVGKTELRYELRAINDLHAALKKHGDWMLLGSADEQKPAAEGTVEAWGRSQRGESRRGMVWPEDREKKASGRRYRRGLGSVAERRIP